MKRLFNKLKETIKTKYFLIPFLALSLVCFLVVISGLNEAHLNPFTGSLDTLYPSAASYSDRGLQLVDDEKKRLLICDSENKLTAVADTGTYGSPVEKFAAVTTYGDRIYVIGTTSYNQGWYLSSEKIVEFDMNGNLIRTVYSETYTEESKESRAHFSNLSVTGDGIYLTKVDGHKVTVVLVNSADGTCREFFSSELPETVYSAGYDPTVNCCIATGVSQNCYYISCDSGEITIESFKSYLERLLERFGVQKDEINLESFSECFCIPAVVLNDEGATRYYCIVDSECDLKLVLSDSMWVQDDISKIEYSTPLRLRTIGFWLAVAVLCIEALALLVWLLVIKGKSKSRTAIFMVGIIMLLSYFYIGWLNDASEENYITSLKTQSGQICQVLSTFYGDTFEEIQNDGVYEYCTDVKNQAEIEKLCNILKKLCDVNDSEHTIYAGSYLYDSNGVLYTFADSNTSNMAGEPIIYSEEITRMLAENRQGTVAEEDYSETLVYNYEYIYSADGSKLGVLFLCWLCGNLRYVQAQDTINMTVSITALLIGIYMLYTIFKTFSADLLRRRGRDSDDLEGKSLDLAGILSFTKNVVYLLDSAIAVYVAKTLCVNLRPSLEALMVSLPITAVTLGGMLGLSASSFFRRRLGDRLTAVLSAVITLADMVLLAFSVRGSNIWLYTAGSFFKGFFLGGVIYALIQTIPLKAKTDSGRRTVLASVSNGASSSSILSVLAGGYVSQYLSYYSVYMLGAAISVILIFICLLAFVKKPGESALQSDTKAKKSAVAEYWTFFLKGPGLVYVLCYIIPWSVTSGYGKYLFPLYTSGAGMSALLLSNLTVFVRTFTFLTIAPLREFSRKVNKSLALIAPQIITCLCLICFILSPNIYWAVAVMFISELMSRAQSEPAWIYITELAERHNLDAEHVCSNELTIEQLIGTVQTPLLSAVVSLGINYACAAVGAVTGCLCAVFALVQKRIGKSKRNYEFN